MRGWVGGKLKLKLSRPLHTINTHPPTHLVEHLDIGRLGDFGKAPQSGHIAVKTRFRLRIHYFNRHEFPCSFQFGEVALPYGGAAQGTVGVEGLEDLVDGLAVGPFFGWGGWVD